MTQGQSGWLVLFVVGVLLIVIGFQGSLGVTLAILFSPSHVVVEP